MAAPAATTSQSVDDIKRQMDANSAQWEDADAAKRDQLHASNVQLGNSVGATYDPGSGRWDFSNAKLPQQSVPAAPATPATTPTPSIDMNAITGNVTSQVNAQIAAQVKAAQDALAMQQQQNQLAITQNNNYLADQVKQYEQGRTVQLDDANTLQNRRGGFYSGGLDYQRSGINTSINSQEGTLSRDIGARNADIYNRNSLLAQQAASTIQQLQNQAPDLIRQRIMEEVDRQRGINIQEAGVTGMYNNQMTMPAQFQYANTYGYNPLNGQATAAMQGQLFNQNMDTQKFEYGKQQDTIQNNQWQQNFDLNKTQTMAQLLGFVPDGKGGVIPTTAEQQRQLGNLWNAAEQTGQIPDQLASMYGLPRGMPTQSAKQFAQQLAISQQNADTSRMSANASISNQNVGNLMDIWKATGVAPDGIPGVAKGTPYAAAGAAQKPDQFNLDDYKTYINTYFAKDVPADPNNPSSPKVKQLDTDAVKNYINSLNLPDAARSQLRQIFNIPAVSDQEISQYLKK